MPRKSTKPPKPKPLFSRPEVVGLCKRFLKEKEGLTEYYHPVQAPMAMYGLIKLYPSREFWLNMDLGFTLRSLFWFRGQDGKAELDRRWSIYNLDLGPQVEHALLDTKVGEDVVVEKPKVSVADFLR